jgi:molybdate transport system substrate-binding protein
MRFDTWPVIAKHHASIMIRPLLLFSVFALAGVPALAQPDGTLTVSAAASLRNVLARLGNDFQKTNPGAQVCFNFGSSGTLRAQIEAGAPVDVFIAADDATMNALQKGGNIESSSRRVLAGNRLVLVVPSDSPLKIRGFRDLTRPEVARVAIGAPSVPAGARAREVFERLGIWPAIQAKSVRGKDVREVLAQVEQGNVEAGVVYLSDAATTNRVRMVAVAPRSLHAPIRYPAAIVSQRKNRALAARFLAYLSSKHARAVFQIAHFVVANDPKS